MSAPDPQKVTLTPEEFAAVFGRSKTWAYRLLYAGKINAVTGYGKLMIPTTEVDKILKSAGRYEGAQNAVSALERSSEKKKQRGPKPNPWIRAVRKRRTKPAPSSRSRSSHQLSSAKRAAIRKLNRR